MPDQNFSESSFFEAIPKIKETIAIKKQRILKYRNIILIPLFALAVAAIHPEQNKVCFIKSAGKIILAENLIILLNKLSHIEKFSSFLLSSPTRWTMHRVI